VRRTTARSTRFGRSRLRLAYCRGSRIGAVQRANAALCRRRLGNDRRRAAHGELRGSRSGASCCTTTFRRFSWRGRSMGGVGRREIGHGALAWRAIEACAGRGRIAVRLRVVSDILESNGSSSMATVCGGVACADAGRHRHQGIGGGVAMGLVKEGESTRFLSDIAGAEDHYGDMTSRWPERARGLRRCRWTFKIWASRRRSCARPWNRRGWDGCTCWTLWTALSVRARREVAVRAAHSHHPDSDGQDSRPDRAGGQGDPRDHRRDRREDRCGRHGARQRGIERRDGLARRHPNDLRH